MCTLIKSVILYCAPEIDVNERCHGALEANTDMIQAIYTDHILSRCLETSSLRNYQKGDSLIDWRRLVGGSKSAVLDAAFIVFWGIIFLVLPLLS